MAHLRLTPKTIPTAFLENHEERLKMEFGLIRRKQLGNRPAHDQFPLEKIAKIVEFEWSKLKPEAKCNM